VLSLSDRVQSTIPCPPFCSAIARRGRASAHVGVGRRKRRLSVLLVARLEQPGRLGQLLGRDHHEGARNDGPVNHQLVKARARGYDLLYIYIRVCPSKFTPCRISRHSVSSTTGGDPLRERAFILNGHSHWYAIRKINGAYLNLNSTLEGGPQPISDFYLRFELPRIDWCAGVEYRTNIHIPYCFSPPSHASSLLQQMVLDGWTVFVVRGEFPQPSRALSDGGRGQWIDARSLIRRPGGASASAAASSAASAPSSSVSASRSSASSPPHRQARVDGTMRAPKCKHSFAPHSM
jgi:hypothetical protein